VYTQDIHNDYTKNITTKLFTLHWPQNRTQSKTYRCYIYCPALNALIEHNITY